MDRDDTLQSLVNIQATLEAMAQNATDFTPFLSEGGQRRHLWATPSGKAYDLTGTLDDSFDTNRLRHVLRWIEFNVDDGPKRRERLIKILDALRDNICEIERGDPSDPFLWLRESIDDAAAEAVNEMQHVADYVDELIGFIEPDLTPTEARAKFCFEEWQAGKTYKEINVALRHHPDWEHFDDEKAVRGPINSWASRIGKEPRKGQPGKRAKA